MAGEKLVRRALQAAREAAKPLPMDEASRMARARSQGFTIDAFKGAYPYDPATGPVYGFKGGRFQPVERIGEEEQLLTHFDTPDKPYAGFFGGEEVANRFAKAYGEKGSVFPVKLKFENPVEIDAAGRPAAAFQFEPIAREHGSVEDYLRFRSAFDEPSKYDGVIIKNTADEGTIYIPRTPQQVRSRFAEFNPEKITSKDLLAGGAGVGAVGAAMEAGDMAQQGAEEPSTVDAGLEVVRRASGGRLLEDEYPTKYLPNVGRQVMADGGAPDDDIRRYEARMAEIAKQPEDIRSMTHAPSKPLRPVEIEGGLIGKRTLGEVPYDVAGPLAGTAQLGYTLKTLPFYFTPAAPLALAADTGEAAIDMVKAAREGDYLSAILSGALGVAPGLATYRKSAPDFIRRAREIASSPRGAKVIP